MAEAILNQPQFQDAEKAREYLEALRWPTGVVCPHCGVIGAHYPISGKQVRPGVYKCKDCREQFTVTVGTVFEDSKVPLNKWLQAVHLMCASKKGISSKQLERMLGVTYKTAWFMSHRIREAMQDDKSGMLGGGGKIVEADETYWGNSKRSKAGKNAKRAGGDHKMKVLTLVERDGRARSFHVPNVTGKTLRTILRDQVARDTKLMTDEAMQYVGAKHDFRSHRTVNHSIKEYSRGEVSTNTMEGYFSLLKRGLIGTFHHVGEQHLGRYVSEFDFRYSHRKINDSDRAQIALKGIAGKRLMYRHSSQLQP